MLKKVRCGTGGSGVQTHCGFSRRRVHLKECDEVSISRFLLVVLAVSVVCLSLSCNQFTALNSTSPSIQRWGGRPFCTLRSKGCVSKSNQLMRTTYPPCRFALQQLSLRRIAVCTSPNQYRRGCVRTLYRILFPSIRCFRTDVLFRFNGPLQDLRACLSSSCSFDFPVPVGFNLVQVSRRVLSWTWALKGCKISKLWSSIHLFQKRIKSANRGLDPTALDEAEPKSSLETRPPLFSVASETVYDKIDLINIAKSRIS